MNEAYIRGFETVCTRAGVNSVELIKWAQQAATKDVPPGPSKFNAISAMANPYANDAINRTVDYKELQDTIGNRQLPNNRINEAMTPSPAYNQFTPRLDKLTSNVYNEAKAQAPETQSPFIFGDIDKGQVIPNVNYIKKPLGKAPLVAAPWSR